MTNEELVLRFENSDMAALNELYLQLEPFIVSIVRDVLKKFEMNNADLADELFQVGSAELIERVYKRNYAPDKGSFATYIYPYLRTAMVRHIEQFITPLTVSHKELLSTSKCRKLHRDGMTDENIANELCISKQLVARYLRFSFKTESIMKSIQDEYGEEYLEDPRIISNDPQPDQAAYTSLCAEKLKLLFDKLTPKQQKIVGRFYGAYGYEEMNLGDIAEFELLTEDAVKKQKHDALEQLYYDYWHFSELRTFREAWWAVDSN
ncbi:RNA polymerase primary sigma factor [Ruminococcus sp. YE71]|uniref:sigma-70 family RNA polymerase sigma factor n=1 Tax=Ruminococcus sp. YE71 TaxID=244362 RepID=UPI00088A4AA6|nr:sigma-70 family RNA polymerase sigma factor [Ruminococcus sp. YE71]SDA32260.1 RNA polymerase primary sigma factor [Ruminococcus sp. YE78]SFW53103.1 RNA polymerase primary sigma factor [Ruminococcus sp. YE71]